MRVSRASPPDALRTHNQPRQPGLLCMADAVSYSSGTCFRHFFPLLSQRGFKLRLAATSTVDFRFFRTRCFGARAWHLVRQLPTAVLETAWGSDKQATGPTPCPSHPKRPGRAKEENHVRFLSLHHRVYLLFRLSLSSR